MREQPVDLVERPDQIPEGSIKTIQEAAITRWIQHTSRFTVTRGLVQGSFLGGPPTL